jgi:hypothetical protein
MNKPVLFLSSTCGACKLQKEILDRYFKTKKNVSVIFLDDPKNNGKFQNVEVTPTLGIPRSDGTMEIYEGVIENPAVLETLTTSFGSRRRRTTKRSTKRKNWFGSDKVLYPNINNLAVYGKNFPDDKGFEINSSFYGDVEDKWGKGNDTLNAGIGGTRSLGPDNIGEMYSNGYVNNIRMAQPADQLGTALYLNRSCNIDRNKSTVTEAPGMIYDAKNPQIVSNTTGFGKKNKLNLLRKSRFGGLYSQMGPASEIGNQYLISKDTGKQLYSGARQNEGPRPYKVDNKLIYVGQAPEYNPIGKSTSFPEFGKRRKAVKRKAVKRKAVKKIMSGKKAVNIKISIKRKSAAGKKKS